MRAGLVALLEPDTAALEDVEEAIEEEGVSAMAKLAVSAKTWLMFLREQFSAIVH